MSRAPFQQLNPVTQAGQFGNEGRNVVRGPGIEDGDLSLFKYFNIDEKRRVQFRSGQRVRNPQPLLLPPT